MRPESEVINLPSYSAENKMNGAIHVLPPYAFMVWTGKSLPFINTWTVETFNRINKGKREFGAAHSSLRTELFNSKKNSNKMALLYSILLIPVSRSTCFG
jgi:hypothetical protein